MLFNRICKKSVSTWLFDIVKCPRFKVEKTSLPFLSSSEHTKDQGDFLVQGNRVILNCNKHKESTLGISQILGIVHQLSTNFSLSDAPKRKIYILFKSTGAAFCFSAAILWFTHSDFFHHFQSMKRLWICFAFVYFSVTQMSVGLFLFLI